MKKNIIILCLFCSNAYMFSSEHMKPKSQITSSENKSKVLRPLPCIKTRGEISGPIYKKQFSAPADSPLVQLKKLFFDFWQAANQINRTDLATIDKSNKQSALTQEAQKHFIRLSYTACLNLIRAPEKQNLVYGPFPSPNKEETQYALQNLSLPAYIGLTHQESFFKKSYHSLFLDKNFCYYLKTLDGKICVKQLTKKSAKRPDATILLPEVEDIEILDYSSQHQQGLLCFKKQNQHILQNFFLIKGKNEKKRFFRGATKKLIKEPDSGIISNSGKFCAILQNDQLTTYKREKKDWLELTTTQVIEPNNLDSLSFALEDSCLIYRDKENRKLIIPLVQKHPMITNATKHISETYWKNFALVANNKEINIYQQLTSGESLGYKKILTWLKKSSPNDVIHLAASKKNPEKLIILIYEPKQNSCTHYELIIKEAKLFQTNKITITEPLAQFVTNKSGKLTALLTKTNTIYHWSTQSDAIAPFFMQPQEEVNRLQVNDLNLMVTYPSRFAVYGNNQIISPIMYLFLNLISTSGGIFRFPFHTPAGIKIAGKSWIEFYLPEVNKELAHYRSPNQFIIEEDEQKKEKALSLICINAS